jgi:hypothetical protein
MPSTRFTPIPRLNQAKVFWFFFDKKEQRSFLKKEAKTLIYSAAARASPAKNRFPGRAKPR